MSLACKIQCPKRGGGAPAPRAWQQRGPRQRPEPVPRPTQPPAVSGELHSAPGQVKTTSNQTHARQLFAHVSRRLPGALAAEFLSSSGRGVAGERTVYIYTQGSPPGSLSAAASSLCLHGHVGLLFCRSLLGDSGWPASRLRRGGRSPHALLLAGGRSRRPCGVEGPVLGQRRGRGRRGSRHGSHGAAAVEALGGLEAGEHGEGVGEVGRRGRRVGRSAHLWEGDTESGTAPALPRSRVSTSCLPPKPSTRPLRPHCCSAGSPRTHTARRQQLFKPLKTNAGTTPPVRRPRCDPAAPAPVPGQVRDPLCFTTCWCHLQSVAFQLSMCKAQAQLPPHGRPGALSPCQGLALHAYCTLQIMIVLKSQIRPWQPANP